MATTNFDTLALPGDGTEAATKAIRSYLKDTIQVPAKVALGKLVVRTDIQSLVVNQGTEPFIRSFQTRPEYQTRYPDVVKAALGNLYREYNSAFTPLVEGTDTAEGNREWDTDYMYCLMPDATVNNRWVQIDMVGLPDTFLQKADELGEETVRAALRPQIFEIENSLAHYQLLERLFTNNGEGSRFNQFFRQSLDELRAQHGKPIALLAVTEQKYQAMRHEEFGRTPDQPLTDDEVRELTGFDKFFGEDEFRQYLDANSDNCEYLIYARTSDPVSKLKKPDLQIEIPLLQDDRYRRIIKAHSITMNIDNPNVPGFAGKINDTKGYLPAMGMAFPVSGMDELHTGEFAAYLVAQGVDPATIRSGEAVLRAKPTHASYGGYGHHHSNIGNKKFRDDLKLGLKKRGPHVVQPELQMPVIVDAATGQAYAYIDRNFFSFTNGHPVFMGGFRSLMPMDSTEVGRGRIHGNGDTNWAEVY